MSRENRYDPEDLEQLLSTKSFSELLPEEKAFVLQYMDSDLEYDSLRETFSALGTLPELEPAISPREKTKENLLAAFEENKKAALIIPTDEEGSKKGFWAWFWSPGKNVFGQPALQLASLALVFTVGYFMVFNTNSDLAQNTSEPAQTSQKEDLSDRTEQPEKKIEKGLNELEPTLEKVKDLTNEKFENEIVEELNDIATNDVTLDVELADLEEEALSDENGSFTFTNSDANTVLDVTEIQADYTYADFEGIDAKSPHLDELEYKADEDLEDTELLAEEKNLKQSDQRLMDTAFIQLTEGEAMASDYRFHSGNAAYNLNEVQVARTTSAMDSPSAIFDAGADDSSAPALTANNFSSLLNKLHTAQ